MILPDGLVSTASDALGLFGLCPHFAVIETSLFGKSSQEITQIVIGMADRIFELAFGHNPAPSPLAFSRAGGPAR
jgi:hypothetical protein